VMGQRTSDSHESHIPDELALGLRFIIEREVHPERMGGDRHRHAATLEPVMARGRATGGNDANYHPATTVAVLDAPKCLMCQQKY
jgi:hypothetical protein